MAPTKRKRRTKHRGNAAGTVQQRGRTSKPASEATRKALSKQTAREQRLNRPPTWARSARTALLAGAFMFLFLLITGGKRGGLASAVVLTTLALALYIPAGYYLERYLFRRRQAKQAGQGSGRASLK